MACPHPYTGSSLTRLRASASACCIWQRQGPQLELGLRLQSVVHVWLGVLPSAWHSVWHWLRWRGRKCVGASSMTHFHRSGRVGSSQHCSRSKLTAVYWLLLLHPRLLFTSLHKAPPFSTCIITFQCIRVLFDGASLSFNGSHDQTRNLVLRNFSKTMSSQPSAHSLLKCVWAVLQRLLCCFAPSYLLGHQIGARTARTCGVLLAAFRLLRSAL